MTKKNYEFVNFEDNKNSTIFKTIKFGKYSTNTNEIRDLSITGFLIFLTIIIFQSKINNGFDLSLFFTNLTNLNLMITYFFALVCGFLFHELGHKLVAQYYNFVSEFKADFQMSFLMLFLAIFSPFIFLAPGAVMVFGNPTIKENGIISIAGPLVNLFIVFFALILQVLIPSISHITMPVIYINLWLGIFNMLPFWVLDGKKVITWNPTIYFITMGIFVSLFLYI